MGDFNEKNDMEYEEVEIDKEKCIRMIRKIYKLEKSNAKTGKFGERDMREQIKNIIEEELGRCY